MDIYQQCALRIKEIRIEMGITSQKTFYSMIVIDTLCQVTYIFAIKIPQRQHHKLALEVGYQVDIDTLAYL